MTDVGEGESIVMFNADGKRGLLTSVTPKDGAMHMDYQPDSADVLTVTTTRRILTVDLWRSTSPFCLVKLSFNRRNMRIKHIDHNICVLMRNHQLLIADLRYGVCKSIHDESATNLWCVINNGMPMIFTQTCSSGIMYM